MQNETHHKDGAALAAILSAGIGCSVIGLATIFAEASAVIKNSMNWWDPAGPLSGKTGVGVITWLASWAFLHSFWRGRELPFHRIWIVSLVLIALGWIGTFPPVFEFFGGH